MAPLGGLPAGRVFRPEHLTSGKAFLVFDRLLDTARSGPHWLGQPQIAATVREHMLGLAGAGWWTLDAYAIMPNHVHVLCIPWVSLPVLLRRVKGATARWANQLLGRQGAFWQEESFDRMVRNAAEYGRIRCYIEWNPVRARLVATPEDYPWSSASLRAAELKPRAG